MCILTVIQQAISANTSNTQHLYEYTQTLCKYTRLKPKKVNVVSQIRDKSADAVDI